MYANWATASVVAGGTGNLTVAAISGVPTHYQSLGTKYFSYSLETAAGQPIEAGIGHMVDGTTFMRDRVLQTYDGTNTVLVGATAQNIPANALLICTPLAHTLPELPTTIDSANATGRFLSSADRQAPTGTSTTTALRLYYTVFKLEYGTPVSGLAIIVTTPGAAGTQALLGLRLFTPSGGIGARIDSVAAFAVDTSGIKNQPLLGGTTFLSPGWYIPEVVSSASISITGYSTAAVGTTPFGMGANSFTPVNYKAESLGSFALPTSTGTLSSTASAGGGMAAVLLTVP